MTNYIQLQVPEELYLQVLGFLGGRAGTAPQPAATPEPDTADPVEVGILQARLSRTQRRYDMLASSYDRLLVQVAELREQLEAKAEPFDRDDSYPDHGPEDDAAAGMGLPSLTAGTLTEAPAVEPEPTPEPTPEPKPEPERPKAQTHTERGLRAAGTVASRLVGPVARFLEDTVEDGGETDYIPAPTLHELYTAWQKEHPTEPELTILQLGKGLSANGLASKQARSAVPGFPNVNGKRVRPMLWYGIRPKAVPVPTETPAERRKRESEELARMAAAARAARPAQPAPEPEAPVSLVVEPKKVDRRTGAPIMHIRAPRPAKRGQDGSVNIVTADGKVSTVEQYVEQFDVDTAPLVPDEAPVLAFDMWTDVKDGTNRPYTIADEVMAMYGLDRDAVDAAVKYPHRVEIRPESKTKNYPVLNFVRGDVQVIMGFRTPERPHVMACYITSMLGSDTYRVNRHPGGGSRKSTGLPGSVSASVRQLRARGLEIPDTWESATQPIVVSYKGKELGKMKVHLADKKQVQGDYQRLLRQAHAIDRREEVAAS